MSDAATAALFAAIAPTLTSIATLVATLRTKKDIAKIEVATNSMKDALVASTAKASHAEGREEGRIEERDRDKTGGVP